jgi:hypothetical protein
VREFAADQYGRGVLDHPPSPSRMMTPFEDLVYRYC